jgi:hypothetical protein
MYSVSIIDRIALYENMHFKAFKSEWSPIVTHYRFVTWETSFDITWHHRRIFEEGEIIDVYLWFVIFKLSFISTENFTYFTQCWVTIISEQHIFKLGLHCVCPLVMCLPYLILQASNCRWYGSEVWLYVFPDTLCENNSFTNLLEDDSLLSKPLKMSLMAV